VLAIGIPEHLQKVLGDVTLNFSYMQVCIVTKYYVTTLGITTSFIHKMFFTMEKYVFVDNTK
jgi:hypothetical protein